MKKVGIITMHKVVNYGSALQAYALQRVIEKLGYDCEIIDYIYPNAYHLSQYAKIPFWKSWILFVIQLLYGFPQKKRIKLFEAFYSRFLKLSPTCYKSREQLQNNPPHYDIYVTGSDQVWNPKSIMEDTNFMLSFVSGREAKKISYAASFATDVIPDKYREIYRKCLDEYSAISVREWNGVNIIQSLVGKNAELVLDPTLLLKSNDYDVIAQESIIHMDEPYLLAYLLGYKFNPHPYVDYMVKYLHRKTGYKVVLLNVADTRMWFTPDSVRLRKVGPSEFVYLFKHASLVVTTSFHGTAFSVIYNKPFYALVQSNSQDDRISSLLKLLGLEERLVYMGQSLNELQGSLEYDSKALAKLENGRKQSLAFLHETLMSSSAS